jgi:hypothetical protein
VLTPVHAESGGPFRPLMFHAVRDLEPGHPA